MKKAFSILLLILITSCIILFYYNKIFSINDNKKQLEGNIIQFINKPRTVIGNVDIKQAIDLDDKKYVLFISNNFSGIGDAVLSKGINAKYRLDSTEYGSNIFQFRVQKTNRNKYFIIDGKNYDNKIDYIKVILEGKEYRIKIPQQEYFISYCPVSNSTQNIFPDNGLPKLYDKNDSDITNEIYMKFQS